MQTQLISRPDGAAFAIIEQIGPTAVSWAIFAEPYDPDLDEQPATTWGGCAHTIDAATYQAHLYARRTGVYQEGLQ